MDPTDQNADVKRASAATPAYGRWSEGRLLMIGSLALCGLALQALEGCEGRHAGGTASVQGAETLVPPGTGSRHHSPNACSSREERKEIDEIEGRLGGLCGARHLQGCATVHHEIETVERQLKAPCGEARLCSVQSQALNTVERDVAALCPRHDSRCTELMADLHSLAEEVGERCRDFTTTTIGPAGGSASGPDGIVVNVPRGALDATSDIVVAIETNPPTPPGLQLVGSTYRLGPEGKQFALPVTLILPPIPGTPPNDLIAFTVATPGGTPHSLAMSLDVTGRPHIETAHFSIFGTGTIPKPPAWLPPNLDALLVSAWTRSWKRKSAKFPCRRRRCAPATSWLRTPPRSRRLLPSCLGRRRSRCRLLAVETTFTRRRRLRRGGYRRR